MRAPLQIKNPFQHNNDTKQNPTNASDAAEAKDPSFTGPSVGHDMQHWNYESSPAFVTKSFWRILETFSPLVNLGWLQKTARPQWIKTPCLWVPRNFGESKDPAGRLFGVEKKTPPIFGKHPYPPILNMNHILT